MKQLNPQMPILENKNQLNVGHRKAESFISNTYICENILLLGNYYKFINYFQKFALPTWPQNIPA